MSVLIKLESTIFVSKAKIAAAKFVIPVAWNKSTDGWFKLNSDGASFGNPGKAGIIRDNQGIWVKGYARSIEFTSSIIAELWALRDGLRLADHIGIRYLPDKFPQVRVIHVFREADKCADWLAKWGSAMKEDFAVFEFPFPAELENLVAKDNNGLHYSRLVAANMASVIA